MATEWETYGYEKATQKGALRPAPSPKIRRARILMTGNSILTSHLINKILRESSELDYCLSKNEKIYHFFCVHVHFYEY